MADNIDVKPSADSNAVSVATDVVNGVHYPVYKMSFGEDGEAILVDSINGMPVAFHGNQERDLQQLVETMEDVLSELKIMNHYNSMAFNETLTKEDIS